MASNRPTPLRDGAHYDAMNAHVTEDLPFYVEEARAAAGPVLEVACGTGRITLAMARAVPDVTGLDLSEEMLARAREKSAAEGLAVTWVQADARSFELGRRFALIAIPFNSMQLLGDTASQEAFLARVRAHLAPGGRFIVDLVTPRLAILAQEPWPWGRVHSYPDPEGRGQVVVEERSEYDEAAQLRNVHWRFTLAEARLVAIEDLQHRYFFPQELDSLLRHNGFRVLARYGTYDRRPFVHGSTQQILICEAG